MSVKLWIPIKTGAQEDASSFKKVPISGQSAVRGIYLDVTKRESTQITYGICQAQTYFI